MAIEKCDVLVCAAASVVVLLLGGGFGSVLLLWGLVMLLAAANVARLVYRPVIWPNGKKGPYMWQDPED